MRLGLSFFYYLLNNVGFRFLRFIVLILCARLLNLDDFGVFSTLFSLISIFGAISVFGMHNTVVKFGEESVRKGAHHFRHLLKISFGVNLVLGILFSWLVFAFRERISQYFGVPITPLLLGAASIIPWAAGRTMTFVFRALRAPKKSVIIDVSGPACFVIALAFMAATGTSSLSNVMFGNLVTLAIPVMIGFLLLEKYTHGLPTPPVEAEKERASALLAYSLFTFIVSLSGLTGGEADRLIIACFLDPQAVGQYNAAARSAFQLNLFYISFGYAFAPQLVAERLDQAASPERDSKRASLLFWLAAPFYLAAFGLGRYVMLLFGPGFLPALGVFLTIAVGGYINLLLGPSEIYLRMCGYPRVEARNMFLSMVVTLGTDFLLIPRIGIQGAAIGAASGLVAFKILSCYDAKRRGLIYLPEKVLWRAGYAVPPLWGGIVFDRPLVPVLLVFVSLALLLAVEQVSIRDLAASVKRMANGRVTTSQARGSVS
ncbi:MAG TPA: oligosaccharide flippase family protein [Syntrophobacter fumaroxidans]|nr:oligosaccharide flippase family protein [Syntrophobacter fumaroxidans]